MLSRWHIRPNLTAPNCNDRGRGLRDLYAMSSNVRMRVQFNLVSSKYYSVEQASPYLPSLCGSVRPPAPQELLLLVFLRLLVCGND